MKFLKIIGIVSLVALFSAALADDSVTVSGTKPAATATITLMTAGTTPAELGTTYSLDQLDTTNYTYGADFLIRITYANVGTSVGIALSGSQADYTLVYKHTPTGGTPLTTSDVPFGSIGSVNITGDATDTYAKGADSTAFNGFSAASTDATVFAIGAMAAKTAAVDLSTTVNITATVQ